MRYPIRNTIVWAQDLMTPIGGKHHYIYLSTYSKYKRLNKAFRMGVKFGFVITKINHNGK